MKYVNYFIIEELKRITKCFYYSIRHWWYFLWVRKDEFHRSLEIDSLYIMYCNPKGGVDKHYKELIKRRNTAHAKNI